MRVNDENYRTIWLDDSGVAICIIDQTELPHRFVVRKLSKIEHAADAIKNMQVRGAPLIGVTDESLSYTQLPLPTIDSV